MTTRHRRLFAGLPVILLAPLLAAPRGCHFGDGDVPLGHDGTGGDAGMAGEGGSSSVGGSSTLGGSSSVGGSSTLGGSSSVGGSSTFGGSGGTGGSSIGGAGGETPAQGCIETLSAFDPTNPRGIELSQQSVEGVLARDHRARLTWVGGAEADVTLTFVGLSLHYVESRIDPDFNLDIPVTCENHLRVVATGRLASSDGRLDETLPGMRLNIGTAPFPGTSESVIAAYAVTTIAADQLRGSYAPAIAENECFQSLQFNVTVSPFGFDGSLLEAVGLVPCGVKDPNSAVFGGEAGSWQCVDGYCVDGPATTQVVEAESCDGIGEQLTASGDESTFTRSGNTLRRRGDRGCGCALYPDFVMAWAPQSPLELRLCAHESRNACTAACSGELSYDLATAFRAAGTSEFRFVD